MNDKEYCVLCTNPTEKAGIDEDSIYIEVGPFYEIGPLCDDCFKLLEDNFCRALRTRIAELEAENEKLRKVLEVAIIICPLATGWTATLNMEIKRIKKAIEEAQR